MVPEADSATGEVFILPTPGDKFYLPPDTITESHNKEVGKQPQYGPTRHQIAEVGPQQQIDLARWNNQEHEPCIQRVEEATAAYVHPEKARP